MKVLLLEHPRNIKAKNINDIANAPLSSCLFTGYIAGMLEKDYKVDIVEGYLEGYDYCTIYNRILEFEPDILGVHLMYQWKTDWELYGFLEKLKQEKLVKHIFSYGYYSHFTFEELLHDCKAVDGVVLGEPETVFCDLISLINKGSDWSDVDGIALRDNNNEIKYSYAMPKKDLDNLPFPIRSTVSYNIGEVNIMGSRGCYGGCTFCYINPFIGNSIPWRGRSPQNIIDEIDNIIEKTGLRKFYFTDPNFFGPGNKGQQRALELAALLKKRDVTFGIEARVNDIHENTINALTDAGLRHILIGLESGRQETLKRLNKMTTVEQNERAIRILRKYNIEPNVGFIMFEPDSSVSDLRENFNFLNRNELIKSLDITVNVLYHHQIILKGSKSYKILLENNRLKLSPYSSYEGNPDYENEQVAAFAGIMREITNFIFNQLKFLWDNKNNFVSEQNYYRRANKILVDLFENVLRYMESGNDIDSIYQEKIINTAEKKLSEIFEEIGTSNDEK